MEVEALFTISIKFPRRARFQFQPFKNLEDEAYFCTVFRNFQRFTFPPITISKSEIENNAGAAWHSINKGTSQGAACGFSSRTLHLEVPYDDGESQILEVSCSCSKINYINYNKNKNSYKSKNINKNNTLDKTPKNHHNTNTANIRKDRRIITVNTLNV